tara:strand:+ start:3419 stop:4270 length:852 start_codon:yes stop_codon:yes gene_type:complete
MIDQKNGIVLIKEAGLLLDSLDIRWWLTDGTLLGLYRDGKLMDYDEDIDLGCFIEDYNEEISNKFIAKGWNEIYRFGTHDIGLEISLMKYNVKLDLFFFYKEIEFYWHGAWQELYKSGKLVGRNMIKYIYAPFTLRTKSFNDFQASIPYPIEKYIITKYGTDWKQPIRNWDWRFDPKNAKKTNIIYYNKSNTIHNRSLDGFTLGIKINNNNEGRYIQSISEGRISLIKGYNNQARKIFWIAIKQYPFRFTSYGFYIITFMPAFVFYKVHKIWKYFQRIFNIKV